MRAVSPVVPVSPPVGAAVNIGDWERLLRLDSLVVWGVDGRSARKNVTNCFFKR